MNNKIPLSLATTSAKSLFKMSPSRSFPVSQSSWYYPSEDKHQFIGQKACAWRLPKFGNIRKSAIRPDKISEGHLREEGFVILHPMGSLSSHHPTFFGADRICQRHICTPNNRGKELCARLLKTGCRCRRELLADTLRRDCNEDLSMRWERDDAW
jgi:hypothetical protein